VVVVAVGRGWGWIAMVVVVVVVVIGLRLADGLDGSGLDDGGAAGCGGEHGCAGEEDGEVAAGSGHRVVLLVVLVLVVQALGSCRCEDVPVSKTSVEMRDWAMAGRSGVRMGGMEAKFCR
jgi:hypothetical protein